MSVVTYPLRPIGIDAELDQQAFGAGHGVVLPNVLSACSEILFAISASADRNGRFADIDYRWNDPQRDGATELVSQDGQQHLTGNDFVS